MAKGLSVHVGINNADPSFSVVKLFGCRNDAEAMLKIATDHGFTSRIFLDEEATFENVAGAILDAANNQNMQEGDLFLFTFSGHGSTQPTLDFIGEPDGQDETILLHDCILIDNYLRRNLWSQFPPGVRILGVADCCHAGSALFASLIDHAPQPPGLFPDPGNVNALNAEFGLPTFSGKILPTFHHFFGAGSGPDDLKTNGAANPIDREFTLDDQKRIVELRPDIHKKLKDGLFSGEKAILKAELLTLAACRDLEKSRDGTPNGLFTQALLEILKEAPPANYETLMTGITKKLASQSIPQNPVSFLFPKDSDFITQRPFSISVA